MFLHVQSFGKQFSVHTKSEEDGTETSKLKDVIKEAMDYWKQTETGFVAKNSEGKTLDLDKTAKDNWLTDNDYIVVSNT